MARILIVEDDGVLRGSLARALAAGGAVVHEAGSVEEAIDKVGGACYDLVVTDYRLASGGHNGLYLLVYLQTTGQNPPVIMVSGYRTKWLEPIARNCGAFAFLAKPFDIGDFRRVCAEALGKDPKAARSRVPPGCACGSLLLSSAS